MTPATRPQALVTTAEAEAFLEIPARTLRRWAATGKISRYGTPQQLLVDLYELAQQRPHAAA